ncbi:MAG: hypothetical protein KDA91_10915 [Planctomycetaceae bacterium]|nr:hypothetical protein [Planctomycetaceae bacterium]
MLNSWTGKSIRAFVAGLTLTAVALPIQADESSPKPLPSANAPARIRDVKLDAAGNLAVRLLSEQGKPLSGIGVVARNPEGEEAKATSDAGGIATFVSLKPGTYAIPTGTGLETIRVWNARVAPPQALDSVAVVLRGDVVRGQAIPFVAGGTTALPVTSVLSVTTLGLAGFSAIETQNTKDDNKALQSQISALLASP